MARQKHPFLRRLPLIAGAALVLAGVAAFIFAVRNVSEAPPQPKRETPQIVNIVRPPPPPPDEPPPPPPPPEDKVEELLPQDSPEPQPAEEAPPLEQLGLDAEGVAGGDAFGLAARPGGTSITGTGGAAFAWYTGMLRDSIQSALSEDERVRRGNYRVTVRVWLDAQGGIERISLADSTGNPELDAALGRALERIGRLREPPPIEMPQPVTLRIVSRS